MNVSAIFDGRKQTLPTRVLSLKIIQYQKEKALERENKKQLSSKADQSRGKQISSGCRTHIINKRDENNIKA